MRNPEECIRAAEWCEQKAAATSINALHSTLKEIAAVWRMLAQNPESRAPHMVRLLEIGANPPTKADPSDMIAPSGEKTYVP